jgi:hypothetical protein
MKTKYFENKEQYLNFRSAWAHAVNDPRAKKTLEKQTVTTYDWSTRQTSHIEVNVKVDGWLSSAHQLLFNILRGKDVASGFTPVTNHNRLTNGAYFNHGLFQAYQQLKFFRYRRRVSMDERYNEGTRAQNHERVVEFLTPFAGTITPEIFDILDIPEISALESNHGIGWRVAKLVVSGEFKPTTIAEVEQKIEELRNDRG